MIFGAAVRNASRSALDEGRTGIGFHIARADQPAFALDRDPT